MSKNIFLYVGNSLCTRAKACVRRHSPAYVARVSETKQNKTKNKKQKKKEASFLQLWLKFGMNLTSSRRRSIPHFFTIKSLTWYIFKHTKIPWEKYKIH